MLTFPFVGFPPLERGVKGDFLAMSLRLPVLRISYQYSFIFTTIPGLAQRLGPRLSS